MTKMSVILAVSGSVVLVDQISKILANQQGLVTLNTGMSFGLGGAHSWVLHVVGLGALAIWFWQHRSELNRVWPLGMVIAGGISNLVDRIRLGGVQDWLVVPFLGLTNNLADYCVVGGMVIWLWYTLQRTHART